MFICIELIFNMSNGSSQLNNSPGLSGADESHFYSYFTCGYQALSLLIVY